MVNVAQLVRASDCGSEGRGFEPHLSPETRRQEPPFFVSGEKILNYAAKAAFRFAARRSVLGGGKSLLFSFRVKKSLIMRLKPLFASRHAEACLEANNKKLQIFHLKSGMKAKKSLTLKIV